MKIKHKMADQPESSKAMSERFRLLWKRCVLPNAKMNATEIYRDLVSHYAGPGRYYHTWSHVAHCLLEFDRAASRIEIPDSVELALWFHDAVFVPGASDNEQRSADLLGTWGRTSLPLAFTSRVSDLILITMHKQSPEEGDQSYMVDIDLSSFGAEWPEFMRDTLHLREEQGDVPDAVYYPAHAKFLRTLLDRPGIFYTDFFRERYEESARRNIKRLLATDVYTRETSDRYSTGDS